MKRVLVTGGAGSIGVDLSRRLSEDGCLVRVLDLPVCDFSSLEDIDGVEVISGDITKCSTPEEYKAACEVVDGLITHFELDPGRIIVTPGNHDLNWDISAEAYKYVPNHKRPDPRRYRCWHRPGPTAAQQ